jgi:hypothetical protein
MMPADLVALGLMAATARAGAAVGALPRPIVTAAIGPERAGATPAAEELHARFPVTAAPPARDMLKLRRFGSMIDYVVTESGLRLSAGLRSAGRRKPKALRGGSTVYAPAQSSTMAYRTNFKRQEAAMTVGWTLPVAKGAVFGVEAGTTLSDTNDRTTSASIARPDMAAGSWTRLNAVAQIGFALKL